MNKITLLIIASLGLSSVGRADWIDMVSPESIPDNNALGISQTLELSGFTDPIESIEVRLVISETSASVFNGDYFVTLQHDSGYAVLLNRVGRTDSNPFGYSDSGFDVTFTLSGGDIHAYQETSYTLGSSSELTGTWGVDGRETDPLQVVGTDARTATLSSFNGLDPNGNWTLFVADTSLNGEGTLESWGINVTVVPEPTTIALFGFAFAALAMSRRYRHRSS
jgi:subtilisin-like proprotein convertase family protein